MTPKDTRTKLIFVITKSNFGGAQKYVYDLATNLPQNKFETLVVLGGSGLLRQKLEEANIPAIPLPTLERDISIYNDIKAFIALVNIFKKEKPAVIHLNSSKIGIMGALAGKIAGVPRIIFTAHGWPFNENRSLVSRIILKALAWLTVLLSHKTIAVSTQVAKDMNWPFAQRGILVIRNGVRAINFMPKETARGALEKIIRHALPKNAFALGTIAELHPNKGLLYALEAFLNIASKNQNLYYIIIGEGELRPQIETFITEHKLGNRVFLTGFVDRASQYLKAFDAFILPSITEAFPYVLLEAGLAGAPVIASKVGGVPELIVNGATGILTKSKDSSEIAQALESFLKEEDCCSQLGNKLGKKVIKEFSFEQSLQSTVSLYTPKTGGYNEIYGRNEI